MLVCLYVSDVYVCVCGAVGHCMDGGSSHLGCCSVGGVGDGHQ